MTFDEYLLETWASQRANPQYRAGQAYFNTLYHVRPDISERIRGGPLDPFHRNERITDFLECVMGDWDS